MNTSEQVPGFDPATDTAGTPNGGKVKQGYQKLKKRGMDDAAKEIRYADPVSEQLRLVNQHTEFDPKHDDFRTTSKASIEAVYSWLVENNHEEAAERLRTLGTVREQLDRTNDLKQEYPIPR